jgi:hypothetical protein
VTGWPLVGRGAATEHFHLPFSLAVQNLRPESNVGKNDIIGDLETLNDIINDH